MVTQTGRGKNNTGNTDRKRENNTMVTQTGRGNTDRNEQNNTGNTDRKRKEQEW